MLAARPSERTSTCTCRGGAGEKDRRLAGRVAAADDDHLLAAADLRLQPVAA